MQQGLKILIVGDSQTAGAPGRAFEQKLRALGHQTVRIGHSGHGAYDWTRMHWREYQGALRSFEPDQVVMLFGSNDPAGDRLKTAMERFKTSGPKVYYAGPPRYDGRPDVQEKGRQIRDLAKQVFGRTYLDAYPYTGPDVPRARDKVHFGPTGGGQWAEGMLQEWSGALRRVAGGARRLPTWAGPAVVGAAALAAGFLYWRR
jgi:hypothetical protein